jgi:hypothetical protein
VMAGKAAGALPMIQRDRERHKPLPPDLTREVLRQQAGRQLSPAAPSW